MRRQTLILRTLLAVLTAGILCSLLHAQPPPETVTVTGTVTEAGTGQPAAGVTVTLNPKTDGEEGAGLGGAQAVTDEQGQFTLEDVAEGRYTLSLSSQSHESLSQELTVTVKMEPLTLTVKRFPRIRGQLRRPDGTPLAHTPVQAQLARREEYGGWSQEAQVTTDGEGHYEAPVQQPGQYLLTVVAPDVGYARSGELTVAAQDLEGIDLQLAPGASVTGQVRVRGTQEPPRQVSVSFQEQDGSSVRSSRSSPVDEQGRFTLQDLPAGTYQVWVNGEEYLYPPPQTLTLADGQAVTDLMLELTPAPVVSGRLLAPDGTPLVNTPVQSSLACLDPFRRGSEGASVTTDGEGRYKVPVRQPGQYLLTLVAPNAGYARSGELTVATESVEGVDLQLAPGASVAGQVRVRGMEAPPRQVGVMFQEQDGSVTRSSHSARIDEQGRFAFQDLPAGTYQVQVYGGEYLRVPPQALTLANGQAVTDFVVEVVPAPALTGRLLAPDGTPLAGREVEFRAYTRRGTGYHGWNENRLTLDDNSGFTVHATEAGPAQVNIRLAAVGYLRQNLEVREGENLAGLEWRLKPFVTVAGQVREKRSREPLAGLQVSLWRQESGPGFPDSSPQATSGADGRFELRGLRAGEYQVSVNAPGYRYSTQRIRIAEGTPPEELLIEPERGTPVAGRVLGPDGQTPAAGARVSIQDLEQTTDADGRFTFASVAWGDALRVAAEGFAVASEPLRLEGADHPVEVTLTLRYRGGTVTGQVRNADANQPVANGIVLVLDDTASRWGDPPYFLNEITSGQRTPGPEIDFNQWPWQQLRGLPLARTDADGRYQLTHVAEGEYTLYAVAPGQGWARRENVAAREGQETAGVDLEISPHQAQARRDGRIAGRLTGPDGKPLANVNVAFQVSTQQGNLGSSVLAGADGRYVVDLARWTRAGAGPYALTVKVEGFRAAKREQIELGENGTAENVDFQLEVQALGSLAGRVFLPPPYEGGDQGGVGEETPAAGVWVMPVLAGRTWPDPTGNQAFFTLGGVEYVASMSQATVTDAEGRYRIERLETGNYRVYALSRVSRPGYGLPDLPAEAPSPDPQLADTASVLSDEVAVPENGVGEANVTLAEAGDIEGVVRAAEDGQPLADVSVSAQLRSDQQLPFEGGWGMGNQAQTDANGRFQIQGLLAGTYQVSASAPGRRHPGSEVTVAAGATARAELKLREWKPATVSGRVLLPDGQTPAPLAYVTLFSQYGYAGSQLVQTDAEGRFELTMSDPGRIRVVSRKIGYGRAASDWLRLTPGGAVRDVTLTLTEAGTISGQIKGGNGTAGRNGTASVPYIEEDVVVVAVAPDQLLAGINPSQSGDRGAGMAYRRAKPDEGGQFLLTDVAAGPTTLAVFVKNVPRFVQRDLAVPAKGAVEGLTLTVPPARGQISGTVTTADGNKPLRGATVMAFNELIGWYRLHAQTDDQGRYTLSGLPAGTYQVLVNATNQANQSSAEITVGDDPVTGMDFRLSSGGKVTGTVLGQDGQPAVGAWVATASAENWSPGRLPVGLSWEFASVQEDGTYTLEHLAPGEYTLYASAPGGAEAKTEHVAVREGETTAGVNWTLAGE